MLHRVGAGALNRLSEHREHFRIRLHHDSPPHEIKPRFKPVGELAVIGSALLREGVAGTRQAAQVTRLLDFAWQEALDGGELLAWLQRDEPMSPIPLETYVAFRELGYRHRGIEAHARLINGTGSWHALEALPNRRLGIIGSAAAVGLGQADVAAATRRTWLGQRPEPWTVDYHVAYDITHTVYHLTDWGGKLDRLPTDIADYLALWLPSWIDEWAARKHWDLLGELLVVDACLPRPVLDAAIWRRYAAAQSPQGAMPVQRTMPTGDAAAVFDLVHHPTLVAALASVMATSRAMGALVGPAP
ncbi:DUF6895 family protein [Saccharopolyspora kobensis]|uniref:DUF6895 family protein n=1 Tax=Saccharopolyspora kobensis TaxID=146035 RepID=UPI001F27EB81|nr:hypothetical protein [Saccharopolyspora kobensis]